MMDDDQLAKQAQNNNIDNFKYVFENAFDNKLFKRMDQNQKIFTKIMNDEEFQEVIKLYLLEEVYDEFQFEI